MIPRRSAMAVSITIISAAVVCLVVLSPLALAGIARFRSDWVQLSNIGQTYGAISAVLSGLALGGIIASLLYQARDSRSAHEQMTRAFQFDLIKLELEDPSLMAATGAPWSTDIPSDFESLRQFLYVQMWISYVAGSYVTGEASESTVRQLAALELFHGRPGRAYWSAVGKRQIANSKGRRNRFFRLLDDEYNKVISTGAAVAGPIKTHTNQASAVDAPIVRLKSSERVCAVVLAAVIGVLIGRLWRRNGDLPS
jgi:Family of unknown function (DUF6082)